MNELSIIGGFIAMCFGVLFWDEWPENWSPKRRAFIFVIALIVIALLGTALSLELKPVEYLISSFLGVAIGTVYKIVDI